MQNTTDRYNLSSTDLISKLKSFVIEERKLLNEILKCLQEVESRLIYAEMGYPSLYEFCTQHLGYSDGSAYRRIQSMRLLKSLPRAERLETESKIESGKITLTNLSLVHGFIKAERKAAGKSYSVAEKVALISKTEGKSKTEVERAFATLQPALIPQERERVITEDRTEIKFVADRSLMSKLNRIRDLMAHVDPHLTYAQLIDRLASDYLARKDPMEQRSAKKEKLDHSAKNDVEDNTTSQKTPPAEFSKQTRQSSRYIPYEVRRTVWRRDQGKCTYYDEITKRSCMAKFGLQMDHIIPFALGGSHDPSNLRLRCRAHNELHRLNTFGPLTFNADLSPRDPKPGIERESPQSISLGTPGS